MEITTKNLQRFKQALADIEHWKGDAYQNNDEVDRAMRELKTILSTTIYGMATELCPHCDTEQEVDKGYQDCPNCGKELVGCSLCCNHDHCELCPDGTDDNFDMDLSDIMTEYPCHERT